MKMTSKLISCKDVEVALKKATIEKIEVTEVSERLDEQVTGEYVQVVAVFGSEQEAQDWISWVNKLVNKGLQSGLY